MWFAKGIFGGGIWRCGPTSWPHFKVVENQAIQFWEGREHVHNNRGFVNLAIRQSEGFDSGYRERCSYGTWSIGGKVGRFENKRWRC